MITIQKQTWSRRTRYVLMHEYGSCQIEISRKPEGEHEIKAYICNLWVEPSSRLRGLATRLLGAAENIARQEGQTEVWLEWAKDDAIWPDGNYARKIFHWYTRRGYEEIEFGQDYALMRKKL